jgi:hypothetical protein
LFCVVVVVVRFEVLSHSSTPSFFDIFGITSSTCEVSLYFQISAAAIIVQWSPQIWKTFITQVRCSSRSLRLAAHTHARSRQNLN